VAPPSFFGGYMTSVELPWPPSVLSPNNRSHWGRKSDARKKYKADCILLSRHKSPLFRDGKINVKITFFPPNNRSRDMDNMLASIKAGLDAVAQAWGVDDSRFVLTLDVGAAVKHGAVRVEASQ